MLFWKGFKMYFKWIFEGIFQWFFFGGFPYFFAVLSDSDRSALLTWLIYVACVVGLAVGRWWMARRPFSNRSSGTRVLLRVATPFSRVKSVAIRNRNCPGPAKASPCQVTSIISLFYLSIQLLFSLNNNLIHCCEFVFKITFNLLFVLTFSYSLLVLFFGLWYLLVLL